LYLYHYFTFNQRYGEEGLKDGGGEGFTDASSLFEQLFGGGMFGGFGSGGVRKNKKGDDVVHHISCTLEDLYLGKTKKLQVTRQIVCPTCRGLFIYVF
jgi:DnaJ family protein A protein 2